MRSTLILAVIAVGLALLLPAGGVASTPPASAPVVASSTPGQSVTRTWTGTIPPSTAPAQSTCKGRTDVDEHDVRIQAPAGGYGKLTTSAVFTITWNAAGATSDEVLTVIDKDVQETGGGEQEGGTSNEVGSSDGSSNQEQVTGTDLPTATYAALACGYINLPAGTAYTGKLVVTTKAVAPPLAAAPSQGMGFSASVPADPQRDEGEPLIQIAKDGTTYTCGPTGVSNAADYAQVSTDGGKQFHLLGEPPRGQQAPGGGGDCALATAPVKNAGGFFNYAYSGLGPLTSFATATSANDGRDLTSSPAGGATIPGVDRQWLTFLDEKTVLLNYNQQAPRQVVVQKSTDGGLTYGLRVPATPTNPDFPGPLRTLPASQNPKGNGQPVAYFPWSVGDDIDLAISFDGGTSWSDCRAAVAPGQPTLFTTADSDSAGNVYLAYGENATFHTYATAIRNADLGKCAEGQDKNPTNNPGFSAPVQVDRGAVGSTVFPWLTAGGAPGRVAVAFYGSETDGDPNQGAFKGSWNVYVNQSLNLLSSGATFSQTKATTHPIHYDSICLEGLGCDVAGGDRSLADFFAIGYDPTRKALQVVYDTTYKRPGDAEGTVATPTVVTQTDGPSLGGGSLTASHPPTLRSSSDDAKGDAIADYSSSAPPRNSTVEPAADFTRVSIGSGPPGGLRVTMRVADLSDAALAKAVQDSTAQRLLFVFRWFNGYRSAAALARWSPTGGFSFGYNDFATGSATCGGSSAKCLQYPGDQPITGHADQKAGTITLDVPASKLKTLTGSQGPNQRPAEVAAKPGDREYDGTAFALADNSPTGGADQGFLYPLDNAPSMDFRVPGGSASSGGSGGSGLPAGAGSCAVGLKGVKLTPKGRRTRIAFTRRAGTKRVRVDVFQDARGRTIPKRGVRVAHFSRLKGFTWNGRASVTGRHVRDGILFVRLRAPARRGLDIRRFVLRRTGGRLYRRPPHARHPRCSGLIRYFALTRPVLGGRAGRTLRAVVQPGRRARVTFTLRHRGKVVRRYKAVTVAGKAILRRTVKPKGLPRGDIRVTATVRAGKTKRTTTRTARRL
jgi:hypothetical protein